MQLREILQRLIKLLPKQKMQGNDGDGNLQAGRVNGNLHHSHTQAVYNIFMLPPEPAPQTNKQEPVTEPEDAPKKAATAALMPQAQTWPRAVKPQSQQQSATLARMDLLQYRARLTVLEFMNREFQTKLVIELQPDELHRLNKYLDKVLSNPRAHKRKQAA